MEVKRMAICSKAKCYKMIFQANLLYGTKCWVTTRDHFHEMLVAEMHMLKWMCGQNHKENIRNVRIKRYLDMPKICG